MLVVARTGVTAVLFLCVLLFASAVEAETVLIEAESFDQNGGWLIDQQSIEAMGSPYLLAHGLGEPVEDATTAVEIKDRGRYRVWVRTKDWVARWKAPGVPGRFKVLIDNRQLAATLGTKGVDWAWHDAGCVELGRNTVKITLHDLTGFAGRCDAIILSNEPNFQPPDGEALKTWRRKMAGNDGPPTNRGEYDLVVVGGGVAGCCSAISAARLGLDVALIQNRPVLGGNSSSEIRVWIQGKIHKEPYPVLGEIVERLNTRPKSSPGSAESFGDDVKLALVTAEKRISLFLCEHVDEVCTEGDRITAVVAVNTKTGRRSLFAGRWFVDCTGDGTVGFLAGADWESTEKGHLGASNMWFTHDTGKPAPFPDCPWAVQVGDNPVPTALKQLGHWNWESGFDMDQILDAEAIRDNNFRGMYGVWSHLKNEKKLYPTRKLKWAAYVSGRRESRRLLGDVILTADNVRRQNPFPDASVTTTWSIDLHYPVKKFTPLSPGSPFISYATFEHFKRAYPIPYRCFYSRNIDNLFMAGRNISVTHEALGTVRVMATGGMMGETVGRAASLCKKHNANPRDVYEKHLDQLKSLLKRPVFPDKHR